MAGVVPLAIATHPRARKLSTRSHIGGPDRAQPPVGELRVLDASAPAPPPPPAGTPPPPAKRTASVVGRVLEAKEADALQVRGRLMRLVLMPGDSQHSLSFPKPGLLAHSLKCAARLTPSTAPPGLQDVYAAAFLSEAVYKSSDFGQEAAARAIKLLEGMVPLAVGLEGVAWSPPGALQRYVLAETHDALYCAFLGTKSPADLLTSFHVKGTAAFEAFPDAQVHTGYLLRAQSVPAEELHRLAVARGKRLVLAGHSMGGAVASLCALILLARLPAELHASVAAIGFATPPLGNEALQDVVAAHGWDAGKLRNYRLPEDWVPGAVTLWQSPFSAAAGLRSQEAGVHAEGKLLGAAVLSEVGGGDSSAPRRRATIVVAADWCFCRGLPDGGDPGIERRHRSPHCACGRRRSSQGAAAA